MTEQIPGKREMRALALVLVVLWAVTAIAIAVAYRPGGPVDIVVALACFLPVLVAAAALGWTPMATSHRDRVALVWIWIAAVLFAVPVLYGVVSTLAGGGPQILVPSAEAAYAGIIALFSMSVFGVVGFVHQRREVAVFERAATLRTLGLALLLTLAIAAAFGLIALINDQALRMDEPVTSRYGPTDADLLPPFCDVAPRLGANGRVTLTARSIEDDGTTRGTAALEGTRHGTDEVWSGSWRRPEDGGAAAYLRVARQAWLNRGSSDPEAPGTTWEEVEVGLFGLADTEGLTMDGPPHAIVSGPRGSIVAEDLGLQVVEGARARHCRTFIDGATALSTFLPLRWLVSGDVAAVGSSLREWRGEMDWWVFGDGEIGRAAVAVSGRRDQAGWASDSVTASLEAVLDVTERTREGDVTAPGGADPDDLPGPSVPPAERDPGGSPDATATAALESAAP